MKSKRDRVVIVGAGGHAKVIIELLEAAGEIDIAGCTGTGSDTDVMGVPVLGDDSILPALHAEGIDAAFVAVGDNRLRRRITARVAAAGFRLINAVSPRAVVSPRVKLGVGVAVMAGVVINAMAEIGDGVIVNTGATVDHDCRIGEFAHLAPGVNLAGNVRVGQGAFLGVGSRAIPGVSIGAWTTIGAGGVVIRDVPAAVTAVGVPVRILSSCAT